MAITILEGYSRMVLNYHTLEQVIAGSVYGLVFSVTFRLVWQKTIGPWLRSNFRASTNDPCSNHIEWFFDVIIQIDCNAEPPKKLPWKVSTNIPRKRRVEYYLVQTPTQPWECLRWTEESVQCCESLSQRTVW